MTFKDALLHGMTIRESANDGSDFTNPAADYRRLFLGEDAQLHVKDSAGAVTDIGGNVADILDLPTAETDDTLVLAPDGAGGVEFRAEAGGGNAGTPYEVNYVEFTGNVSPTQTAEASADTVVTAGAVSFDGSTIAIVEFFSPLARAQITSDAKLNFWLYDGSSSIGKLGVINQSGSTHASAGPVYIVRRLTPSNASHTYSIRATVSTGTALITAGAGGSGNTMPGFIRISKLTA
jgi:hypothetical protein